jgi:hypothetical protein
MLIHGAGNEQTIVFTDRGLEYLREPLVERKRGTSFARS